VQPLAAGAAPLERDFPQSAGRDRLCSGQLAVGGTIETKRKPHSVTQVCDPFGRGIGPLTALSAVLNTSKGISSSLTSCRTCGHRHLCTSDAGEFKCQGTTGGPLAASHVLARLCFVLRTSCILKGKYLVNLRIASLGLPAIRTRVDLRAGDFSRLIQGETIGATARFSRVTAAWSTAVRCGGIGASCCKTGTTVTLSVVLCSSVREVQSETIISAFFVSHGIISNRRCTNGPSNITVALISICKLRFAKRSKKTPYM
jgi:hypothetical protein